jgi:hypothetical protein
MPHAAQEPARRRIIMTICPVAIAVGCKKCPVFSICPVKGIIGDYVKPGEGKATPPDKGKSAARKSK